MLAADKSFNHLEHYDSKQHCRKVLLKSFYLNDNTSGYHLQRQKLKLFYTTRCFTFGKEKAFGRFAVFRDCLIGFHLENLCNLFLCASNNITVPSSFCSLKKKFEMLFGDKLEVVKTNQVCFMFTLHCLVFKLGLKSRPACSITVFIGSLQIKADLKTQDNFLKTSLTDLFTKALWFKFSKCLLFFQAVIIILGTF